MNCLIVDDDAMARTLLEHYVAQYGGLNLLASCENAPDAFRYLQKGDVDILFLDVEMPEMTGLELLESLSHKPHVVLVTAKQEYALEAFDLEATDYLLKPVKYARFVKTMQRISKKQETQSNQPNYVFIKTDGRLVKLDLADLQYIEAERDYMHLHTAKEKFIIHGTMKSFESKLSSDFIRVHRSFIVRLDQIVDIADETIVIHKSVIPIGASYKETLKKRLNRI
jgi:DNA-binding LytR/AlgR family response regulator